MLDCKKELSINFKRNLFVQLQQDVLGLTEEDLIFLVLPETIIQTELVPLPGVSSCINIELKRFGKRNLLYSFIHKSFSVYIFNKHREEVWIYKFICLCAIALHKMRIERCSIFHESTFSRIKKEHHETLKNNAHSAFNSHDMMLLELETHQNNVNTMTSELLRAFRHKFYVLTQDYASSSRLKDRTLNAATYFLP